jgi:hypothetical protein
MKKTKKYKLDIGCAVAGVKPGFEGLDSLSLPGIQHVHDPDRIPWPFPTSAVEEVYCAGFLHRAQDLLAFMEELWRVLVLGGKATLIFPYYTSIRAWQDPLTRRSLTETTFLFFNKEWRQQNKVAHYPIQANFKFDYGYSIYPEWVSRSQEARDFAIRHYHNVVSDLQVTLEKLPP